MLHVLEQSPLHRERERAIPRGSTTGWGHRPWFVAQIDKVEYGSHTNHRLGKHALGPLSLGAAKHHWMLLYGDWRIFLNYSYIMPGDIFLFAY